MKILDLGSIVNRFLLAALFLTAITACGGSSSGSDPENSLPPAPEPAPEPEPEPEPEPIASFACGSSGATLTANESPDSYVLFESGPVRPLALSEDGSRLLVTNTAANCLEIYTVEAAGFTLVDSVMVGMEPVAVAFANDNEAWVVNHLSDSVSIVDLSATPRVVQTLQVGDEPRDIVFAGPDRRRAFVTAAYRGQNHPSFNVDDLVRSGLGRADVWVYDRDSMDTSLTGNPLTIVNLFADTPRALAVSVDGTTVYAAAFMSGNGSTTLSQEVVARVKPEPVSNADGVRQPDTGLIVKKSGSAWVDEEGTDWAAEVRFDLPDLDVFTIDAMADVPAITNEHSGVGTILFNMAVDPVSGDVFVSNLDSLNEIRFEGPGHGSTTVRGRIAESRIAVLGASGVTNNHLNPHIDFDVDEGSSYPGPDVARSLSQPTNMVFSPDGSVLYVAAFGSAKVAAIPTEQLRTGNYVPSAARHAELADGGPSGLVISSDGEQIIVYTRFDNAISLWRTEDGEMLAHQPLFSPEPAGIIEGRRFLYDALETSANGTSACSSCHIFGDMDQLAWDLGDPDASLQRNPNEYVANSPITTFNFHPMKGPMTTQTLRGIADSGPQHWRGDRTGQNRALVNGELESIEAAAFKEFNPAFVGLVGRTEELSAQDLQVFTDFALAITPPPNPVRNLDNSLTPAQARGEDIYFNVNNITGIGSCNHCHVLNPEQKQFGTSGLMSFEGAGIAENFKIPHIRNAYSKVGMFGTSGDFLGNGQHQGPQIKGFGYLHDGSIATLLDFFASPTFVFPAPRQENQEDIVRFVMAADSNMAPVVGQQVTLNASTGQAAINRLDLLEQQAVVVDPLPECDLIVRGVLDEVRVSLLFDAGSYEDNNANIISSTELRAAAAEEDNGLTFTCVPPGSGSRLALDS
ncbi:hypothetical protein EYC98_14650 [Halieaceae bacterium IMCC14734]|uniref:Cytochrome c domain-containing protein n=1 Tax=Candidatus Litorirhabdus singularis TaxID=2518993 RepID=A0ABT3TIF8_9GAMM|nr:hypothetical protein [Candidatus Litorirhabdus singularis]MCX2982098.1 hypothetical protein [Candidatus Litorirhabdus singularis]